MATQTSQVSKQESSLRGKTTVVTGAGRGIGKAIATLFARAGACSIFIVRDRPLGERVVHEVERQGYTADLGVADVTDLAQISALVLDVMQRHPVIDVLVNNAGIFLQEDREMHPSNLDMQILEKTLAVNLEGPMRVTTAVLPYIRKGGRIINVSSGMGQLAGEQDGYGPAYSISKVALNMYTQLLAAELKDRQIMVDSLDPGWVKTDMGGKNARTEAEEAAQAALFLATRPLSEKTGLFWHRNEVVDW